VRCYDDVKKLLIQQFSG